jgi:hypothetical protein
MSPAGPSASKRFFQAYKVCLETPTKGAKSPAGKPLRRHVSKINRRCSGDSGAVGSFGCSWTRR